MSQPTLSHHEGGLEALYNESLVKLHALHSRSLVNEHTPPLNPPRYTSGTQPLGGVPTRSGPGVASATSGGEEDASDRDRGRGECCHLLKTDDEEGITADTG